MSSLNPKKKNNKEDLENKKRKLRIEGESVQQDMADFLIRQKVLRSPSFLKTKHMRK